MHLNVENCYSNGKSCRKMAVGLYSNDSGKKWTPGPHTCPGCLKLGCLENPTCRSDLSLPSISLYMLLYSNIACVELGYDEKLAVSK